MLLLLRVVVEVVGLCVGVVGVVRDDELLVERLLVGVVTWRLEVLEVLGVREVVVEVLVEGLRVGVVASLRELLLLVFEVRLLLTPVPRLPSLLVLGVRLLLMLLPRLPVLLALGVRLLLMLLPRLLSSLGVRVPVTDGWVLLVDT